MAAAVLLAPALPAGFVNRKPEEAAAAAVRLAEMLVPWLETGYIKIGAGEDAAT
jgi:hypothetical protein